MKYFQELPFLAIMKASILSYVNNCSIDVPVRLTVDEIELAENIRADPWTSYAIKRICIGRIGDRTSRVMSCPITMAANIVIATGGSLSNQTATWDVAPRKIARRSTKNTFSF